jgi:hypothetical protein
MSTETNTGRVPSRNIVTFGPVQAELVVVRALAVSEEQVTNRFQGLDRSMADGHSQFGVDGF